MKIVAKGDAYLTLSVIDENDILHEKLRGQDETIDLQTKQQRSYNKNNK